MYLDFDVAVVTAQGDDGWYGVQIKGLTAPGEAKGWMDLQLPFGFASWPLDADIGDDGAVDGCFVFVSDRGRQGNNGGFAWLGHDPRMGSKCPPRVAGSSCQWNAKGAFNQLNYDTDTATLYVPVAFSGGTPTKAHLFQVGFDANGKTVVDMRHCDGMALVMLEKTTTLKNAAGDAYLSLTDDGAVLNGNTKLVGAVDIGGTGALPVALAPALVSYLGSLETLLTALATAIDGKTTPTPGVSVGAVSAFISATAALKTALTATLTKAL